MDHSTAEQWGTIVEETFANQPRVAETVLQMLRELADITDGFATDQLTHCLQTATRAERDGADDEVVVASLSATTWASASACTTTRRSPRRCSSPTRAATSTT